ncbi:MAG: hypothetical protein V3S46_00830 [Nitrospinota bacterium]
MHLSFVGGGAYGTEDGSADNLVCDFRVSGNIFHHLKVARIT